MTIEQKIFSWKDWDQIETGVFQFSICEFNKDLCVGPFQIKKGTYAEMIVIDYQESTMNISFDEDGKEQMLFSISLKVDGIT